MQSYTDRVGITQSETFIGRKMADIYNAMDERKAELESEGASNFRRAKIGRNSPCHCGSGRKFKKCCIDRARLVGHWPG